MLVLHHTFSILGGENYPCSCSAHFIKVFFNTVYIVLFSLVLGSFLAFRYNSKGAVSGLAQKMAISFNIWPAKAKCVWEAGE